MDLYNLSIHLFFSLIILVALYTSFRTNSLKRDLQSNLIPSLLLDAQQTKSMRSKVMRTLRLVETEIKDTWQIECHVLTQGNAVPSTDCMRGLVALVYLDAIALRELPNTTFNHKAITLGELKKTLKKQSLPLKIAYEEKSNRWSLHES